MATTLNLTIEEVKAIGALTPLSHLMARQKDLTRFQMCLKAGVSPTATDNGDTLAATALKSRDDAIISALWSHAKEGMLKAKDLWAVAVEEKQKKWFDIFLKELTGPAQQKHKNRVRFQDSLKDWLSDNHVWAADAAFEKFGKAIFPNSATACLVSAVKTPKAKHWVERLARHNYQSREDRRWDPTSLDFEKATIRTGEKPARLKTVWISPLTEAVKTENWEMAELLLESGYPVCPSYIPHDECNEILMALEYGVSDKGIRFLLDKGCSPLLPKEANWNYKPGLTPEEVESEFQKAKSEYQQENASIRHGSFKDRNGDTFHYPFWDHVLSTAFEMERFELIGALVDKGCSIERLRFVIQEANGVSQEAQAKWDRLFLSQKFNDATKDAKPRMAL